MTRFDLDGRVAVVTGGAKGIGRAIAERLQAGGAVVTVWDLTDADGFESIACDVTSPEEVDRAVARTLERHGRIDILVNNAGIAGPTGPVETLALDTWRRVLEINLTGTFLCSKAVVPVMKGQRQGRIVNIASIAGKEGPANFAAYSASKAGVIALTKSLGKELVKTGVLVNCIAPGGVETELLEQMAPEYVQAMIQRCPMGRLGTPAEVAAMAAWLASDECTFNTGAVFDLSGGRAVY
jgi:3-oxoacyl-[acyl-carrier protein] reductase